LTATWLASSVQLTSKRSFAATSTNPSIAHWFDPASLQAHQEHRTITKLHCLLFIASQGLLLMKTLYRSGQIVPSSNVTMETEIPAMLQARQLIRPERFAFHSSRMRMNTVSKEEMCCSKRGDATTY